ncbi:type II toxin-antitoxin system VapC family toxin [Brevibacterium litoralis]|uniref:type II toxin-antitoxin system VapC family toxin n=1 Tax=Brevibacterium litoralis TaxID=3138935 RepID=UPI0032EFA03C
MKYLIDTNVLSDSRNRRKPRVTEWMMDQDVDTVATSAIVLLELERGVRRVERRDTASGRFLRDWLDGQVRSVFDGKILPVDDEVAVRAARLMSPDPKPHFDCLIAATALAHGLTVVTQNVRDFSSMGVDILDPTAA